jgi:hypothetical protein
VVLNADCSGGVILAELVDRSGRALAACRLAGVDGTALPLIWDARLPKALPGQEVAIRFSLTRAQVYALSEGAAQ